MLDFLKKFLSLLDSFFGAGRNTIVAGKNSTNIIGNNNTVHNGMKEAKVVENELVFRNFTDFEEGRSNGR